MLAWMSFADPRRPARQSFLGVAIVRIDELDDPRATARMAIEKSHQLGINPGGEVQIAGMPDDAIPERFLNRLLSRQELIDNDLGESTLA